MGRLIIFTGSGISAESGIPTFRGGDGLWDGHPIEQVCDYRTWKQNADAVHAFYNERRVKLAGVEPNAFHKAVSGWQALVPTVLMTQNVDDLLERAGCKDVVHLHGNLQDMHCTDCGTRWGIGYSTWNPAMQGCPRCKVKGNSSTTVKPGVVFFHEMAPEYDRLHSVLSSIQHDDLCLVVGTSLQVLPFDMMLYGKLGQKVLNNLGMGEDELARLDDIFDMVIDAPCTKAIDLIDGAIKRHLVDRTSYGIN